MAGGWGHRGWAHEQASQPAALPYGFHRVERWRWDRERGGRGDGKRWRWRETGSELGVKVITSSKSHYCNKAALVIRTTGNVVVSPFIINKSHENTKTSIKIILLSSIIVYPAATPLLYLIYLLKTTVQSCFMKSRIRFTVQACLGAVFSYYMKHCCFFIFNNSIRKKYRITAKIIWIIIII